MRALAIVARFRTLGAVLAALAIAATPAMAAENLPPVNTVPGAQTTNEDTALSFSSIAVSDPDAGASSIQVGLSALNGTITLGATANLGFIIGDGTDDATATFNGTIADLNAALQGMTYTPGANFNGGDLLTLTTDDLGHTGTGGAQTDADSVAITVTAVNDSPVNAVPGAQVTIEETALAFSAANGNAISVSDVDAGSAIIQVTLDSRVDNVAKGTLGLSQTTGLTFTAGDGAGDPNMTFRGSVADINAALDGMTFTPPQNVLSGTHVKVTTSDLGNTGSGGTKTDVDDVAISMTNTDDPPNTVVPSGVGTYEAKPRELSLANLNQINVNDVDDPESNNTIEITLAVSRRHADVRHAGGPDGPQRRQRQRRDRAARVAVRSHRRVRHGYDLHAAGRLHRPGDRRDHHERTRHRAAERERRPVDRGRRAGRGDLLDGVEGDVAVHPGRARSRRAGRQRRGEPRHGPRAHGHPGRRRDRRRRGTHLLGQHECQRVGGPRHLVG